MALESAVEDEDDATAAAASLDWARRHCFAAVAARSLKREHRRAEYVVVLIMSSRLQRSKASTPAVGVVQKIISPPKNSALAKNPRSKSRFPFFHPS